MKAELKGGNIRSRINFVSSNWHNEKIFQLKKFHFHMCIYTVKLPYSILHTYRYEKICPLLRYVRYYKSFKQRLPHLGLNILSAIQWLPAIWDIHHGRFHCTVKAWHFLGRIIFLFKFGFILYCAPERYISCTIKILIAWSRC